MSPTQAYHTLTGLVSAEAFRLFAVRTAGGDVFRVDDPRRIALPSNPAAGTFAVYMGESLHIVGLDSITSIEVPR